MKYFICFFVSLCMFYSTAQVYASDKIDVATLCKKAGDLEVPYTDITGVSKAPLKQNCDAEALYYGIGMKADPVQARACALSNITNDEAGLFNYTILVNIYANGAGVARNPDLAVKFACHIDETVSENIQETEADPGYQVTERMRTPKIDALNGKPFEVCDAVSSGMMIGDCALHAARMENDKYYQKAETIKRQWNAADQATFANVQNMASKFFDIQLANEENLVHDNAHYSVQVFKAALEKDNNQLLEKIDVNQLPMADDIQLQAADKKLNILYKRIQQSKNLNAGSITKDGIKITQRAWLAYRDAWVDFAKVKYPAMQRALEMALMEKRIDELEHFNIK